MIITKQQITNRRTKLRKLYFDNITSKVILNELHSTVEDIVTTIYSDQSSYVGDEHLRCKIKHLTTLLELDVEMLFKLNDQEGGTINELLQRFL